MLFLCNIDYVVEKYINELKYRNTNHFLDIINGDDDKNEDLLKSSLMVGTFFSKKKMIILRHYKKLSKETLDLIRNSYNHVFLILSEEDSFFKKLEKTKIFIIKKAIYKSKNDLKELVNQLTEIFESYDDEITNYLVNLFVKTPNKLIQELIMLSIWKPNITKKDVLAFYKDFDDKEIFDIVKYLFLKDQKKFYKAIDKIKEQEKIMHFFNYLAKIVMEMQKMKLYEEAGYNSWALPINWWSKNFYKLLIDKSMLSKLTKLIEKIEVNQKLESYTLTKEYFQDQLLLILKGGSIINE